MRTRVEELFHTIADLSPVARARYFAERYIGSATQSEVEALLEFDCCSNTSLKNDIGGVAQEVLAQFEPEGTRCGPFLLTALLGRGGMGSVYSAERVDGEVKQRVAVKLLRPEAGDPCLSRKFLAERQILASLSHPNIASLVDAGHMETGQPYLVMEYVKGTDIDTYTAGLGTRQKITLFLKVCAAVGYLHRNLVVHRDLKPANILVTEEGEPKLLDFGIAKMLDATTDCTATSMRMLTPDYASPEQVTGGQITTATDIYSLGAVLYKMLTGESPHRFASGSAAAIAQEISSGKITPPSKLVPDLKGDLEAILMKALRTEPGERYASVDAFADDVRACLEWRPVRARSDDVWYRARRFLRRYWAPAAGTALVIAGLSTALFIANYQRSIAERRFGQLRQLSKRVIDVESAMGKLPGSVEARKRLISASMEYLEGLSPEAQTNLDLAQEISDGYWRMARIQGVNTEFNLGDQAKAEENLEKAETLIELVLRSRPKDRNALFRSAVIAHDRMIISDDEWRADVVIRARKTVERLEAFLRHDDPQSPVHLEGFLSAGDARQSEQRAVATLYVNIALAYISMHLYEEGTRYARRAVELALPIPSAQDMASKALSVLATALRYQGDLEAALRTIRQARTLSERAVDSSGNANLFYLYTPLLREGRILFQQDGVSLDRPAEAISVLQKALNISEEAARNDASDGASRVRVGAAARELGGILLDRDPRRALAVYELGIRRLGETQNSLQARRDRAVLLAKSSHPLRRLHRASEAKKRIDAAFAILKDTKDYPAERIRPGNDLDTVISALADHLDESGDPRRALEIYEDLFRKVLAWPPAPELSLPDAVFLSRLYMVMAVLNRRTGRYDHASDLEARRLKLWHHWDAKLPRNDFVRRQLNAANTTESNPRISRALSMLSHKR